MASAGRDGQVIIWDATTLRPISTIEHGAPVRAVAFSPNDELLVYGSEDETVTFWDLTNNRPLSTEKVHTDFVQDLAFTPDGSFTCLSQ